MRTIVTELVDMSKKAVSGRMPSISPFGPSATCSTSAAAMASHASSRTTQFYDRRRNEVRLDEVEQIVAW